MLEAFIVIIVQVSATLLLGAFFGIERRLRGYPDASRLHAVAAAFGLMAMIVMRPEAAPPVTAMTVAVGLSFMVVAGIRAALQAIAESPAIFSASGADTFTLAGALCAGAACGTADVRSVAAIMIIMALISMFRPVKRFQGSAFARNHADTIQLVPRVVFSHPANDDEPTPAQLETPAASRQNAEPPRR